MHIAVTRSPSDAWVAQQLREATPFGLYPKYLIRDNDRKYGEHFMKVAAEIEILRTPVRAPRANVYCQQIPSASTVPPAIEVAIIARPRSGWAASRLQSQGCLIAKSACKSERMSGVANTGVP